MSNPLTTRADELALIAAAQAGDQSATLRLWEQYRPLVRATAGKAARSRTLQPSDREDLEADLTVELLETIKTLDVARGYSLAAVLPKRFAGIVSAISTTIAVPRSTLSRYYAIIKEAGDLVDVAAQIAPTMGMTTETFWSVHSALRVASPEAAEDARWSADDMGTAPPSETAALVDLALDSLTDKQRAVIELAYGFRDGSSHSDDWISEELGLSKSYVRRVRATSLDKMRHALGADRLELVT